MWVHYPRIIVLLEPLVLLSTMKFERVNKRLGEIAVSITSGINVPLTIAVRHQLKTCYSHCLSVPDGDTILGVVEDENKNNFLRQFLPDLQENIHVKTLRSVEILGYKFKKETVFVVEFKRDGPIFGRLETIFYFNNQVHFFVHPFETLDFNLSYHAFNVNTQPRKENFVINIKSIPKVPPCLFLHKTITKGDFTKTLELVATRYDV